MMRPSTEGCTEWSCPYHGRDNREKAEHAATCSVFATTEHLYHINGTRRALPECSCGKDNDDDS